MKWFLATLAHVVDPYSASICEYVDVSSLDPLPQPLLWPPDLDNIIVFIYGLF